MLASSGEVVQPRWTSGSFLLYTGGAFVLAAAVESYALLGRSYGDTAFLGWAALIFAGLTAFSVAFYLLGSWIAAGVFAFSALISWGVLLGALERWFGWLPRNYTPLRGFHPGVFLLVLLVLAASLGVLDVLRFPLLMALVAAAAGFFVTDLISNGGNWSAVVTLFVGLGFFAAGLALDRRPSRPYAFWLHVAAGVTAGGALIWFWHKGDTSWALVAVAGVAYIAISALTRRSSYAVLGVFGLYLAAIHFVDKWSGETFNVLSVLPFLLFAPFAAGTYSYPGPDHHGHDWAAPLTYAFLGFLLVALGLLHERRDARPYPPAATASTPDSLSAA